MEILFSACAGFVLVYILGMERIKMKPFSCEVCVSGWCCCFLCIMSKHTWYLIPFHMTVAMIAVIILTKFMKLI